MHLFIGNKECKEEEIPTGKIHECLGGCGSIRKGKSFTCDE